VTAINEAYARIDFSYLRSLEEKISSLEKKVQDLDKQIDSIDGEDNNSSNKRFVSKKIPLTSKSSSGKITFSPAFASVPVVFFSTTDESGVSRSVTITEITKNYVKFSTKVISGTSKTGKFQLHMIAMGRSK
jgi:hypothetical protein